MAKKKASRKTAKEATEFVVLKLGDALAPGATVTFLATLPSEKKAMDYVHKLADSSATRVAILEKRRLIVRRPAMAVSELHESIMKPAGK